MVSSLDRRKSANMEVVEGWRIEKGNGRSVDGCPDTIIGNKYNQGKD